MNLYSLFLSEKEQTKLKLFLNQKEKPRFDLIKFAEENFFTYRTLLNYSKEIKEDLKKINKINKNPKHSESCLVEKTSVEEYLKFLYLNNFGSQMIYYSLVYPDMTMESFLEKSNVSQSKVTKFISKLNKSLQRYNLSFSSKRFCLKGDEQIIQLLFYNLMKGPYFEIDSFFSKKELKNINSIFKEVFITENKENSNFKYKHFLLFFKINVLRLKQNKTFNKIAKFPPTHYNLDLLKDWYMGNFGMDNAKAEIQAAYIDYFYSFSPYTLNGNAFITVGFLCKLINIDPKRIHEMKQIILDNELVNSNTYLERRLLSNILFTVVLGISFMHNDDFKSLQKINPEDEDFILSIYDSLFEERKMDIESKKAILKYIQIYKNAITMKFAKVKIYFTSELFFSGSGLFFSIFQNIAEFYSINSLSLPVKDKVIIVYEDDSDFIRELEKNKNIILYQWIFELSYGENLHRISELLYRTSSSFYSLLNR